jgi:hypothetical protein
MFFCTIIGFFGLRYGQHVSTEVNMVDGTSYKIWDVLYNSDMICSKTLSFLAQICQYSPTKESILCINTVVFVVAKLYVLTEDLDRSSDILLEVWHISPTPEDPTDKDYDAHLIDFEMPLILALPLAGHGRNRPGWPSCQSDHAPSHGD